MYLRSLIQSCLVFAAVANVVTAVPRAAVAPTANDATATNPEAAAAAKAKEELKQAQLLLASMPACGVRFKRDKKMGGKLC